MTIFKWRSGAEFMHIWQWAFFGASLSRNHAFWHASLTVGRLRVYLSWRHL